MQTDPRSEEGNRDIDVGSRLCLECGLCCQGVLHRKAVLLTNEVPRAVEQGLELVPTSLDEKPRFTLPCSAYCGDSCTVYEERPACCKDYVCSVLQRLHDGLLEFDEAIATVTRVKLKIRHLRERLGLPHVLLWDVLVDTLNRDSQTDPDGREADPEIALDAGEVLILLRREFL